MLVNFQPFAMKPMIILAGFIVTAFSSCAQSNQSENKITMTNNTASESRSETVPTNTAGLDTATFANGCFWCTEAIFEELDGVVSAVSGYTGGVTENPDYKSVCSGETGHAECLQITYDPAKISFDELLVVFFGRPMIPRH